ncbi:phage major capsid protein [Mycobacteroides abscessus]|nr:phage major capsid protein [Mycobacteroides abscessus]MDM2180500.1 phage major capsid protein [Mycobacteroides abscessus]MDM2209716.1 phage major capsid protein [Mycobacteroides abscessus]MDM2214742.1 phage major capsid protein [Mycobacteroides abscessus]MDM2219733.1 phage major capsid protein [Mycobacteroides abscessus]
MANFITPDAPKAWAPDVQGLPAAQVIPESLVVLCTHKAATIEGDAPYARIPKIDLSGEVEAVREGDPIPESEDVRSEVTVHTAKIGVLVKASRESLLQPDASQTITDEMRRAITYRSDVMFLAQPAPVAPETWPPAGLLALGQAAGDITDNLDAAIDAVALIENTPGGGATHIIANPLSYAYLRKFKTATDSEVNLLGAGTTAGPRTLLDLPVITRAAVPEDVIVIIDSRQVLAAYNEVLVARDDSYFFNSDSVALRGTFRWGVSLNHPDAVQVLTVPDITP